VALEAITQDTHGRSRFLHYIPCMWATGLVMPSPQALRRWLDLADGALPAMQSSTIPQAFAIMSAIPVSRAHGADFIRAFVLGMSGEACSGSAPWTIMWSLAVLHQYKSECFGRLWDAGLQHLSAIVPKFDRDSLTPAASKAYNVTLFRTAFQVCGAWAWCPVQRNCHRWCRTENALR
jgi:hypothetical protein